MPVRRRVNKRRTDDIAAWWMYLEVGHDFSDSLADIGVTEPVPARVAKEAWERLAPALIDRWHTNRLNPNTTPWAIDTFGVPRGLKW